MLALRPLQTHFWACWGELSSGLLVSHLLVASDFQNYCYQISLRLFRGFCKFGLLKYLSVYWQRTDDQKGKLQDQSSPAYPRGRFACKLMRGHCSSPPVLSLLWFEKSRNAFLSPVGWQLCFHSVWVYLLSSSQQSWHCCAVPASSPCLQSVRGAWQTAPIGPILLPTSGEVASGWRHC